jgi:hypothetical protein
VHKAQQHGERGLADTAYRSAANEAFLVGSGFVSQNSSQEAEGPRYARGDTAGYNAKSTIRSRVEHIFAEQKDRMDLFIRRHRTGADKDRRSQSLRTPHHRSHGHKSATHRRSLTQAMARRILAYAC